MAGPQYPPSPSGPPPPGASPPPAAPPPGAWGPPPPGPWAPPPSYARPPVRTEPFAIVSLAASLGGFFLCGVGQIVGIVFGHLARSRIKRSGDDGNGLALAGLIIGYATIAFGIALITLIAIAGSHSSHDAAPDSGARLADNIEFDADSNGSTPRDADLIRLAISEARFADDTVFVGATDLEAVVATDAELAAEDWRLDVRGGGAGESCVWLPSSSTTPARIVAGACRPR